MLLSLLSLTSCGLTAGQPAAARGSDPPHYRTVLKPHVTWYPVSVGSPALFAEGSQISSVLAGPDGRIYYGTENPFGNANTIGWLNPSTHANQWAIVPNVNPLFPKDAGMGTLDLEESATWGAVNLVVSGPSRVWYQHWGYVGAWTTDGSFREGTYTIPGATSTNGRWTASVSSGFSGLSSINLLNLETQKTFSRLLPGQADTPISVALGRSSGHPPAIWLLTSNTVWRLSSPNAAWQSEATLPSGDFFVAMGWWGRTLWTLDANGQVDRVSPAGRLVSVAHLAVTPLDAATAPHGGLWIALPHHISLWEPHHTLQEWPEPPTLYPSPAKEWSKQGANEPTLWPPIAHISQGPHDTLLIGDGTWVGIARLSTTRVQQAPHTKGGMTRDQ